MENDLVRKKDLIQFYQHKRMYLFLDEWGFYLLLVLMHHIGISLFILFPVFVYGSIALYTSYKNIDLIESKIVPVQQEIYSYRDLYSLLKLAVNYYNRNRIVLKNVDLVASASTTTIGVVAPATTTSGVVDKESIKET
jgi:hypothetical protein